MMSLFLYPPLIARREPFHGSHASFNPPLRRSCSLPVARPPLQREGGMGAEPMLPSTGRTRRIATANQRRDVVPPIPSSDSQVMRRMIWGWGGGYSQVYLFRFWAFLRQKVANGSKSEPGIRYGKALHGGAYLRIPKRPLNKA